MKNIVGAFILTMILIILIPSVITLMMGDYETVMPEIQYTLDESSTQDNYIKVYNPETEIMQDLEFEEYIKGVVAAEMPASFEFEALKAQAVAARTYAYKRINDYTMSGEELLGDGKYRIGQAYLDKEELQARWGEQFESNWQRISKAVEETRGEIMIFQSEPIEAVFHSTSAGMTEDAINVWAADYPYLKSVESAYDQQSPEYYSETVLTTQEMAAAIKNKYPLFDESTVKDIHITDRSEAGYVNKVTIGDLILSGVEFREILSLRSSNFSIKQEGDNFLIASIGYGHGAGMSQYGANYMAANGYTYQDILLHYYTGVQIIKD